MVAIFKRMLSWWFAIVVFYASGDTAMLALGSGPWQ
jgi:hypothetical protein